ncbi:hypothetical protein PV783_25970 [Chitinophaga sp. CC14]|uniref:hypothetical protein n=1 Tax=Chitinophaga sp. CC14 TaxID=3029199 RepID=UPI003B776FC4
MRKIFFIAVITLLGGKLAQAQQSTPSPVNQVKEGYKQTRANTDYSMIYLRNIAVTDAQKPQVNKIILNYLDAKRTLALANKQDLSVYRQQQPALFNDFKTKLAAVLNSEQMSAFMASKPPLDDKKNLLRGLFY